MFDVMKLHNALNEVCPIVSVRIEVWEDPSTWNFDPAPEATAQEIEAGQAILRAWSEPAPKDGGLLVSA